MIMLHKRTLELTLTAIAACLCKITAELIPHRCLKICTYLKQVFKKTRFAVPCICFDLYIGLFHYDLLR